MKICIFGADGGTGSELVKQALDRGWSIVASSKGRPKSMPVSDRLSFREADVLGGGGLERIVEGCDAVCSALGVPNDPLTLANPPPIYTEGTKAIVQGMKACDIARLVVVSASFVEEKNRGPLYFKLPAMAALSKVFDQMGRMEDMLRGTEGIDWTAVRPGWLMAGERTDDYVVQPDVIPEGLIRTRRADVATLMLDCIENGDWVGQTPAIARKEPDEATSPAAVAREMMG